MSHESCNHDETPVWSIEGPYNWADPNNLNLSEVDWITPNDSTRKVTLSTPDLAFDSGGRYSVKYQVGKSKQYLTILVCYLY